MENDKNINKPVDEKFKKDISWTAMKLVSWNVNGVRACSKKGFLPFLKKYNPDILCIQETKAHPDQVSSIIKTPLHSFWSISDISGYSGTAVYSKVKPFRVRDQMGINKFDREGRFLELDYKDFILFNIYFPNGSRDEIRHAFKQEFLKRILYYFKKCKTQKKDLIVAGDYNIAYLDIDVFDPQALSSVSGFLPEERAWFREFLSLGFTDVYRYFYPDKAQSYTWWSYRENARKLNRGWRIDHICVTQGLKKRLKSVEILNQETSSDHCPIAVHF